MLRDHFFISVFANAVDRHYEKSSTAAGRVENSLVGITIVANSLDNEFGQPVRGIIFSQVVADGFRKKLLVKFLKKITGLDRIDTQGFWIVFIQASDHVANNFLSIPVPSIQVPAKQISLQKILDPELPIYAAVLQISKLFPQLLGRPGLVNAGKERCT